MNKKEKKRIKFLIYSLIIKLKTNAMFIIIKPDDNMYAYKSTILDRR